MWDPTGSNSCVFCKGKDAPIFLGLKAMKECVGVAYPEASSYDAISRLHKALTPLMRHIDIAGHKQPTSTYKREAMQWTSAGSGKTFSA